METCSTPISFLTPPLQGGATYLSAPTNLLSLNSEVVGGRQLQWSSATNASSYRIVLASSDLLLPSQPNESECAGCIVNWTPTRPSFVVSPDLLTPGMTYYWRVKARSTDQFGDWSAVQSFQVQAASVLSAPLLLSPAEGIPILGTQSTLSWQPVIGASSYRVFVASNAASLNLLSTDSQCASCEINSTTTENTFSLDVSKLAPGRSFYWKVKGRSTTQFGQLSVARRFVISQTQCTFTFTQSSLTASVSGGALPFTISTQSGCTAPINSNQNFCTLSSSSVTADAFGQASISATLAANTSSSARSCTITLGGATILISQSGTAPATAYTFTLNQSSGGTATGNPGTGTYSVGTNINLTAFSSLGFQFAGWQDSGTIVSTSQNWNFSLFSARTITPVFSSTVTTVTGLTNPNFSPDQKWRVLGTGFDNIKNWQGNGETASVIGGNT